MLAKKSILQFRDFVIIKSDFAFFQFQNEVANQLEIEKTIAEYPIEIDFVIQKNPNQEGNFIFTKIAINKSEKPMFGYSIFAEGVGFIQKEVYDGLPDNEIMNQVNGPAINYAINQIRGFIMTLTSNAPLGRYVLPAVDLNDLIKSKIEEVKNATSKEISDP